VEKRSGGRKIFINPLRICQGEGRWEGYERGSRFDCGRWGGKRKTVQFILCRKGRVGGDPHRGGHMRFATLQ